MTPTLYLTNAASRRPPHRGPGRVWTIMAAPRPRYGEAGEGSVPALVPPTEWMRLALAGEMPLEEYRRRYLARILALALPIAPGELRTNDGRFVGSGDTLLCACSRERASRGECHRVWAAEVLATAGWRVVLDGQIVEVPGGR